MIDVHQMTMKIFINEFYHKTTQKVDTYNATPVMANHCSTYVPFLSTSLVSKVEQVACIFLTCNKLIENLKNY